MPNQDGLRFLFDITDKITAKLAKIEAKAKASSKNIDKAFTRASKSQQANAAKSLASQKRLALTVEKTHAKAIQLLKRESDAFKRSMGRMAAAATVAFAAVAGKAIQMAGGYDLAMRSVQAKTGATGELMDRLSEQSREMGRTTVHSATEAARGQAFLAQAGFDANEILEALPATLALATAGELDLASAADITSNVLSGFRMETDQTGRVVDVLALAAASTNTHVSQLGEALAKAAPSAAAAGWSLEEVTAAIGKLSDAGIQGEEAGTALKTMMAKLAIDGGPAERLMAKMGITVKDTTGQMLPLNDILTALAPHANDVGLQMELLGTRGGNAGLVLGAAALEAKVLTSELENAGGSAQLMADIMSGGLWGSIKAIQSIIESAYISFGKRFTPAIQTLAKLFAKLPSPIQEVVVVVGSLAGAMGGLMVLMPQAFGALTSLPGKLIKVAGGLRKTAVAQRALNVAMRLNPIGLVITAVAALAAGIFFLWKRNKKLTEGFDASAVSTEELTQQLDDLNSKIDQQTASLDRMQATNQRASVIGERRLRGLVEERDELARHVRQREITARSIAMVARRNEELAQIAADRVLAESAAAEAARVAAAARVQEEASAAQAIVAIEAAKRLAIVGHIQQRRDAELAANDARVQGEADAAQAIVDIEAAKRRAIVLHIQKRREKLRDAELEAAEATDKVEQSSAKLNVTLAALAGQMGGAAGQSLNLVAAMLQTNDQLKEGEEGFSRVQIGTATAASGFHMLGDAIGGTAGAIMSSLGNVASAFATGGIVAGVMAGVGELIKGIMSIGGPSEAQLAARETFAGFHQGAVEALGGTQRYADEVQVAIDAGWDRTLAETRAGFILWGTDAGLTYDQAFAKYQQYQDAVAAGNTALMEQLEAEFEGYRTAAEEANEAAAKSAEEAAAKSAAAWEKSSSAAISGYEKAKAAGIKAYDEVMDVHGDYVRAVHAGDDELAQEIIDNHGEWVTSHDATLENAIANQADATAEILADEGEKYARIAAFEAAMALGAHATAAERSEAAREAARVATESWGVAMDAVTASDQAANDAMNETWNPETGDVVEDVTGASDAIQEEMAAAERDIKANFAKMADEAQEKAKSIEQAFNAVKIKDQSFTIREHRDFSYSGHQDFDEDSYGDETYGDDHPEGRQHGGPVIAGRRYRVGERGPEDFIPSRSGRIDPNVSSGGGGVDAKALAKAVAAGLDGAQIKVDGRQLGRLVVRHQPLAIAELGGRR